MATPIRWNQRRRVAPYGGSNRPETPLRSLAVSLTHVARAALTEPYMLTIEHKRILLNRLPKAFDGFRVVQLSDVHHGPFSDREQIERAVDTANRLKPDIIALTGDYISKERRYAAPCAEMLGRLEARHGVYAVLGNHDHWTDAALITDLFRAEGSAAQTNACAGHRTVIVRLVARTARDRAPGLRRSERLRGPRDARRRARRPIGR